ncbi:type IV secretory system conjugative DNA transfer family protein [Rhodococcus artemisiae]|uniref:TraM recognition domain-containing protein n=1 Tax=Rhodococcus artemisiae TaxID=714159 RepID=A0ABU7LJY3_9NOCA|nr:TraM recognition domain-containing protein [Rhodococcus artemisiae]MEE2061810.1 TraM recognition domain-containing protein [Rhodococcus artemisiae]
MCAVVSLVVVAYVSWWIGATLSGSDTSGDPITAMTEVVTGSRPWPVQATVVAGVLLTFVAALVILAGLRIRGRTEVDSAARTMVDPRKLKGVSASESQRLVPQFGKDDPRARGFCLGDTVRGNRRVYLSWENVMVVLAGTRMGKTAAIAVPAIMSAPGAVIVTTNKPDLYPLTRGPREKLGKPWLFDLQGVTGEPQLEFWWNPLKQVRRKASADNLASFFVSAATAKDARTDAYFDPEAQDTLSMYFLAAALAGGDLLHVKTWLDSDQDPTVVQILEAFEQQGPASTIRSRQNLTGKQRDGIFGMARKYLNVLNDDEYATAVLPPARAIIEVDATARGRKPTVNVRHDVTTHARPEFDPIAFASSTDTLYALSKEGPGSAAALTTALVGQVFEAAEALASRTRERSYPKWKNPPKWFPEALVPTIKSIHGRLEIPLVAVLDEVTNTVLLKDLPDQYSHFGGRGIIPIAILQSPQQGVRMWGRDEFEGMLAGSVHYYGGNVKGDAYLRSLSGQIGSHEVLTTSRSSGRGGGGTSQSWQERSILPIDALAALPKERAIVCFPANRPVLIKKLWWWEADYADEIRDSIRRYAGSAALSDRLMSGGEFVDEYDEPESTRDVQAFR